MPTDHGDIIGSLDHLVEVCHTASRDAGWYTDIQTGKPLMRNVPEMLMLTVSEVAEAGAGWDDGDMDRHLPAYPAVAVELADTLIRLFDLAGYNGVPLGKVVHTLANRGEPYYGGTGSTFNWSRLFGITMHLSEAMEGFRKQSTAPGYDFPQFHHGIGQAVRATVGAGALLGFHMRKIVDAKLAYNRQRADHKIENRKLVGGKAF